MRKLVSRSFLPLISQADKTPSCIVPSYIPSSYVLRSLSHYSINPLYQYFCQVFGEDETTRLFEMYRIGTSSKWGGAAVFWQIDINGQVRTGKVMCYNAETGHRVKGLRLLSAGRILS